MPHSVRMDENTRIGDVETSLGKGEPTEENLQKIKSALSDIIDKIENNNANSFDIERLKIKDGYITNTAAHNPIMNRIWP